MAQIWELKFTADGERRTAYLEEKLGLSLGAR